MNIILLLALWTQSMTSFINGVEMTPPAGTPSMPTRNFQTFVECMSDLDKMMAEMQHVGMFDLKEKTPAEIFSIKLVGSYENGYELELSTPDAPMPRGERFTMRWECKEIKTPSKDCSCTTDSQTGQTSCSCQKTGDR